MATPPPGSSPSEPPDAASWNAQLRRALAHLKPEDRQVIRALYVERLTMRETARVLDVSEKRVARRAARAMQSLGTAMIAAC